MSFPASNRSKYHSELILVSLSCSPLAVTVNTQKDHYILLRQEGGGFPPDQETIHHLKSSLNALGSIFELIGR